MAIQEPPTHNEFCSATFRPYQRRIFRALCKMSKTTTDRIDRDSFLKDHALPRRTGYSCPKPTLDFSVSLNLVLISPANLPPRCCADQKQEKGMKADANTAKLNRLEKRAKGNVQDKRSTTPETQSQKATNKFVNSTSAEAFRTRGDSANFGGPAHTTGSALLRTHSARQYIEPRNGNDGPHETMIMHCSLAASVRLGRAARDNKP